MPRPALHEMQLALEEVLLGVGCVARPVILPHLLAVFGMKQAGNIHAFERARIGGQQGGESGVYLDDGAATDR